jgi:predicted PurR-regulated permease PerM
MMPAQQLSSGARSLRVLAVCAAVLMLQFAAPVLLPVVVSVLLFYALDPIVDRLERWRVPRVLASVAVVLGLVGALGAGGTVLGPEIESVVTKIPAGAAQLRSTFRRQRAVQGDSTLEKVQAAAKALDSAVAAAGQPATSTPGVVRVEIQQPWRASDWLWAGGMGVLGLMGQAITVMFLTIFLLNEDDAFKRKLVQRMDTLGRKRVTVQVLNAIAKQIEGFIWVQALTSSGVAIATGFVLWWLGVEEPAVWGLFAGIMNIVPYFGPLIVTIVLAAVSFLQFGTFEMAALVAGVALAITTFEGMLLTPHLLSRAASLNHVAIFLAIAFWSWAWGVPGMLLAVPMLMATKAISDHVEGLEAVSQFLGE